MQHPYAPSRRHFLKTIGFAAPAIVAASALGRNGAFAANDRINIGLLGNGNINGWHCGALLGCGDARLVAVADPFSDRRANMRDRINNHYKNQDCKDYRDFRELLARTDIDAVCIGTPDHWHATMAVMAMKAGKDVYCEKPMVHTIAEGRIVADTAATYGRIFQTGTQQRSDGNFRFACELVRNGRIGKLKGVQVGVTGINGGIQAGKNFPTEPVPEGLDYDLWQGPAAEQPYSSARVAPGNAACYWYYISHYTIGFLSGWGIHHVDIAQWGLGYDRSGPVEVNCTYANIPDDGLIDDVIEWTSELTYAKGEKVTFSSIGKPCPGGVIFEGEDGKIHVDRGRLTAEPASLLKSVIRPEEIHLYESPEHHRNWLDCMRSRRETICPAEIGHRSTTVCNLVEISARLGRKVKWNPEQERFVDDEPANRLLSKAMRSPWRL
jgi:predicted dehydrogenase